MIYQISSLNIDLFLGLEIGIIGPSFYASLIIWDINFVKAPLDPRNPDTDDYIHHKGQDRERIQQYICCQKIVINN